MLAFEDSFPLFDNGRGNASRDIDCGRRPGSLRDLSQHIVLDDSIIYPFSPRVTLCSQEFSIPREASWKKTHFVHGNRKKYLYDGPSRTTCRYHLHIVPQIFHHTNKYKHVINSVSYAHLRTHGNSQHPLSKDQFSGPYCPILNRTTGHQAMSAMPVSVSCVGVRHLLVSRRIREHLNEEAERSNCERRGRTSTTIKVP